MLPSSHEITGQPSTECSAFLKNRYLQAPLMVDIEYIRYLTESHKKTDGMEIQERRALNHAPWTLPGRPVDSGL